MALELGEPRCALRSKTRVEELSMLSRSPPLFDAFIPVGCPNMGDKASFFAHIEDMWESRVLANNGPKVRELEEALCALLRVRHFVTTCNGTAALKVAVRALGLTGEVIVPSFTFIATAHCLEWLGITPVFCDVDAATHTLDVARVEALITPRTTGIIGVHLWGQTCDTDALGALAARRGLKLMYDAAHAVGCSRGGVRVGGFGSCEVFSFHATKVFNTFEGGGIATNDDALAAALRRCTSFGFEGQGRVSSCVGTNGKMTEACASMGHVNLAALPRFIAINHANAAAYAAALAGVPGVRVFEHTPSAPDDAFNHQYVVLEYVACQGGLSRDDLATLLAYENISARRYFFPGCHRMQPYASRAPTALLPVTDAICAAVLCLPTGTGISVEQIRAVCDLIRFLVANSVEISARIAALPAMKRAAVEPGSQVPRSLPKA